MHSRYVQTPTIKLFAVTRQKKNTYGLCTSNFTVNNFYTHTQNYDGLCQPHPTWPCMYFRHCCLCRQVPCARRRECPRGGVAVDRTSEPCRVGGGDNRFSPSPYHVQLSSCRVHTCRPSVKWYANIYVLQTTCGMHVHCEWSLECTKPFFTGDPPKGICYDIFYILQMNRPAPIYSAALVLKKI